MKVNCVNSSPNCNITTLVLDFDALCFYLGEIIMQRNYYGIIPYWCRGERFIIPPEDDNATKLRLLRHKYRENCIDHCDNGFTPYLFLWSDIDMDYSLTSSAMLIVLSQTNAADQPMVQSVYIWLAFWRSYVSRQPTDEWLSHDISS